jgi:hypothetical protein
MLHDRAENRRLQMLPLAIGLGHGDEIVAVEDAAHARDAEQPVGEHMAALAVGGELDLVHGDEIGFEIKRHRLHGADVKARGGRLDLLLARDERDLACADAGDDLVVDLARKEPQRKADDPNIVGEHALDGEMGLAGIGRPEHGGDAAPPLEACGIRGERPTHIDSLSLSLLQSAERGRNESRPNR